MDTKENKEAKKVKMWKRILSIIFIILSVMLVYVLIWSKNMFGNIPFAQVLFHLMVPLEGTDSSIVISYIKGVIPIIIIVLVYVLMPFVPDMVDIYWAKKKKAAKAENKKEASEEVIKEEAEKDKSAKLKKTASKRKESKVKKVLGTLRRFYTRHLLAISSVVLVIVIVVDVYGFGIDAWLKDRFNSSSVFENYYVDSSTADIEFPVEGRKKNLIYILCESLESSFADLENGGSMNENLIPNLTKLAEENTHFSSAENLAGATEVEGTGWTIAAMVSQMSGVPLMLPIGQNGYGEYAEFLPGITSLGELLEKEGYVNEIILGSKSEFSGVDNFFKQHGNYNVFDYYTAKDEGYISGHNGFWGYEDRKLFEIAKEELRTLNNSGQPFNVMINTIDLHTPKGYACSECTANYVNTVGGDMGQYMDIVNCQDRQIYEFVEWCKTQDFYEDTVIIISGDHLSMAPVVRNEMVPIGHERTTYHVIINSDMEATNTTNRDFTTMDMYPTILASLGCKIKGERLGIGTNLYSGKKTVMEELGKEAFKEEISKNSVLYNEDIVGTR